MTLSQIARCNLDLPKVNTNFVSLSQKGPAISGVGLAPVGRGDYRDPLARAPGTGRGGRVRRLLGGGVARAGGNCGVLGTPWGRKSEPTSPLGNAFWREVVEKDEGLPIWKISRGAAVGAQRRRHDPIWRILKLQDRWIGSDWKQVKTIPCGSSCQPSAVRF